MTNIDVALTFYKTAREEMLLRIKERDLAFYAWLAALGTILSLSFRTGTPDSRILLIIPLLAAGVSFRISQHELLIGTLAKYCKEEIGPILKIMTNSHLRHWDESESLSQHQKSIVNYRGFVNFLLIFLPSFISLLVNNNVIIDGTPEWRVAWLFSAFVTLLTFYFLYQSMITRFRNAMKKFRVLSPLDSR